MYFLPKPVFHICANAATLNPCGQIRADPFIIHAPLLAIFPKVQFFFEHAFKGIAA